MRMRYDLFKCWLLTSYGFQLLTSQIVYPPPTYTRSPFSTPQSSLDCCCVSCTFAVEDWESYQAYGRLFNWKRVEWTFLHLKHMWGSADYFVPPMRVTTRPLSPLLIWMHLDWARGVIWFDGMLTCTCGFLKDLKWLWKLYLCLKPFRSLCAPMFDSTALLLALPEDGELLEVLDPPFLFIHVLVLLEDKQEISIGELINLYFTHF